MVDLLEIIDNIITEVERNHLVIIDLNDSPSKMVIDIDYLRHHVLLKDARIFHLIMGFNKGLWKKPDYTPNKYKSIFKNFNITYYKWTIFREFLNCGELVSNNENGLKQKLRVLFDISSTFGGIPYIDKYYNIALSLIKHKNKIADNPLKPEDDHNKRFQWGIYNGNAGYIAWLCYYKPEHGWTHIKSAENDGHIYARRPLQN